LRIDHHGSTAIPGLGAKPIIDIQVSVAALQPLSTYGAVLEAIGYVHVPHPDDFWPSPSRRASAGRLSRPGDEAFPPHALGGILRERSAAERQAVRRTTRRLKCGIVHAFASRESTRVK
jgi:GrpB-like predicted nucleotidyltransferase (UPF0157 family)